MPDRMGSINFIFAQLFCSTSEKKAFGVIVAVTFIFLFLSTGNVLAFSSGQNANLVLGQASFGSGTYAINRSGFDQPEQVAFGPAGNAWITDTANNRILEFKKPFSNGEDASLVIGQPDFETNKSATSRNGLSSPTGVAFDPSGNLWVSDAVNNRILEFKKPFSNGEDASLVIGQRGFTTNVWAATPSEMYTPAGIVFGASDNLWVSDSYYNRVLEFKKPFSNGEDASVAIGQQGFFTGTAATNQSGLRGPVGIAFDSSDNLWVTDIGNNRVLQYPHMSGPSPVPEFPSGYAILASLISLMIYLVFSRSKIAKSFWIR